MNQKSFFSLRFSAYLCWLLSSLLYGYQFFWRSSLNAIADHLMSDFHINAELLGVLASAYYIPYVVLQIPLGISLDIWGPKKILRWGCALCSVGGLVFSLAPNFPMAFLGRFLIGVGASGVFIGGIQLNQLWFPLAYVGFAVGGLSAFGKMGGAAANALLLPLLETSSSWHAPFQCSCGIGCVLLILIVLFIKNGPRDQFVSKISALCFSEIKTSLMSAIRKPVIWSMGVYSYALYLTLTVFSDTYSIDFLSKHFAISKETAGILTSLVGIGSAIGSCVITFLSDRLQQRKFFARLSALGVCVFGFFVFFLPALSIPLSSLILFLFGFFSGGQVLSYIIATETLSYRNAGMTSGIINTLAMAGGIFHNWLIGWIMQKFWDGRMHQGYPVYSIATYRIAFSTLFACFALAVLMAFYVKESHPKKNHPNFSL